MLWRTNTTRIGVSSMFTTIGLVLTIVVGVFVILALHTDRLLWQSKQDSLKSEFSALGETFAWGVESWMDRLILLTEAEASALGDDANIEQLQSNWRSSFLKNQFLASYYGTIEGDFVMSAGFKAPEGYDHRQQFWFAEAVNTKGLVVTEPYRVMSSGDLAVTIAKPVYKDGDLQGVIGNDVAIGNLIDLLQTHDSQLVEAAFLIDQFGEVLAHTDPEQIGRNVSDVFGMSSPDMTRPVQTLSTDAQRIILATRALENIPGTNWRIGITADYDLLVADLSGFRKSSGLAIVIASILLVLGIGFLTKRRVMNPVLAAQKEAEAASALKTEFIRSLTQQVRAPLRGVMSIADHLKGSQLGDEERLLVETIEQSGRSLLTMLNDVSSLAEIETDEIKLTPAPFSLTTLIDDIVSLLGRSAADKNIELLVRCHPELPEFLVGDSNRVRQAMTSIIANAIRRTPRGYVLVNVGGKQIDEAYELKVCVKDSGVNLDPKRIDQIFSDRPDSNAHALNIERGRDLGLSVTYRLIRAMGGDMQLVPHESVGSILSFTLSLAASEGDVFTPAPVQKDLKGVQVLIVDDHAVSRRIQIERLRSWGIVAIGVGSMQEAVAYLKSGAMGGMPFQLVITRRSLPDGNGIALTYLMRRNARLERIPVLITSPSEDSELEQSSRKLTDVYTLQRPYRSTDLQMSIARLIAQNRARQIPDVIIDPLPPMRA